MAGPGDDPAAIRARLGARLGSLRDAPLPPLDPRPRTGVEVASVGRPAAYEAAVAARRRADPRR